MRRGVEGRGAVVAGNNVTSVARGDIFAADTAERDVVAAAENDYVVAADGSVDRDDVGQETAGIEFRPAIVADHNIARNVSSTGRVGVDIVLAAAAEDDVRTNTSVDQIIASGVRFSRLNRAQDRRCIESGAAIIADHDIGAGASRD